MTRRTLVAILLFGITTALISAQALNPEQKAKVQVELKKLMVLGSDPVVVKAVKEFNAVHPDVSKGMTQDKWTALTVLSDEVKYFARNPLAVYLKTKRTGAITELFVSCSDGTKAAFFAKTTSWSHKGKPKHDVPMTGSTWIGELALDESSGKVEVQVSFPVLDQGQPIGSIVIGLDLAAL